MSTLYFIRIRGKVSGPFDEQKLHELAGRGQFSRFHEVSVDNENWEQADVAFNVFGTSTSDSSESSGSQTSVGGSGEPVRQTEDWYYAIDGRESGPVSLRDLRSMFARRIITGDTLVWKAGMQEWTAASNVEDLATALGVPEQIPVTDKSPAPQDLEGKHDQRLIESAIRAIPWILFIAIVGAMVSTLHFCGGIWQAAVGFNERNPTAIVGGLTSVTSGAIIFTGTALLWSYRHYLVSLRRTHSMRALCRALAALNRFWVFTGIILSVLLAFFITLVIWCIAIGATVPFDLSGGPSLTV